LILEAKVYASLVQKILLMLRQKALKKKYPQLAANKGLAKLSLNQKKRLR
jgi:hypothetical protein